MIATINVKNKKAIKRKLTLKIRKLRKEANVISNILVKLIEKEAALISRGKFSKRLAKIFEEARTELVELELHIRDVT